MRTRLKCLVTALIPLTGCLATPPYVEVEVGAIAPRLSGDVRRENSSGDRGSNVSMSSELAVDDRPVSPYGAVRGGVFGFNGSLSAFQSSTDGSGTLDGAFGDLPAGTRVDSDADFTSAKAAVTLDLLSLGPVRFAAGLGLEHVGFELKADAQSGSVSEKITSNSEVPLLVGEGELELGPIRVLASVAGMTGSFDDLDGPLLDMELTARFSPLPLLEFFAGYRYLDFDLDGSDQGRDFQGNLTVDGFLAGAALRF